MEKIEPIEPDGETIVAAACWVGMAISLPPPARHDTVMKAFMQWSDHLVQSHEQGFLTSKGRFVGREEAYLIAYRAKQIQGRTYSEYQLYSEDLW